MDSASSLFLFWLKKSVSVLIMPPLLPFFIIFIGLILVLRHRRGGFVLLWAGLVMGMLAITPASVDLALSRLEPAAPLRLDETGDAQAIVILGGGRYFDAQEYGGDTVSDSTLERLRYGAWLARKTGLPILVTGGAPGGRTPEAQLMKSVLEEEFQIPVQWVEDASLDTRQNARNSAGLLQPADIRRILLVTHAAHMRRARNEFEAQGFVVTAAPTVWLSSHHRGEIFAGMPGPRTAQAGWFAWHEWLGLIAYRLSR